MEKSFSGSNSLSRRKFLWGTAALGAALPGPRLAASRKPSVMKAGVFDLGFSLYGMPGIPIDEAMQHCARIGYGNVELAMLAGFPTAPDAFTPIVRTTVKRTLAATGLSVSSLLVGMSLIGSADRHRESVAVLRQAAEIANALGQDEPPVIQTVLGGAPADFTAQMEQMAGRLREWDAIAAEQGVTLAVKAHVASSISTPEQLWTLIRRAGTTRIAVGFDQSHYQLAGIPVSRSFASVAALTRFVHLKDAEGDATRYQFKLPGEGSTDYQEFFACLRRHHYRGPVVVEVSRQIFSAAGYDPILSAQRCFERLSPFLNV